MKMFYVEHSVITMARHAIIAKDEEDLKKILGEREEALRTSAFKSKLHRVVQNEVISYQLSKDWPPYP